MMTSFFVDSFVASVRALQKQYAEFPAVNIDPVKKEVLDGMSILDRNVFLPVEVASVDCPELLYFLQQKYDLSQFSLATLELNQEFTKHNNLTYSIGQFGSEFVVYDVWRQTIEVRTQVSDHTLLLAADQEHFLNLILHIQRAYLIAEKEGLYFTDVVCSDHWIGEARRIGGGSGVRLFFSRHQ